MIPSDPRDRPPAPERKDTQRAAQLRAAMRIRGLVKVVLVTLGVSQLMTIAFAVLANLVGGELESGVALLFNFATCALVSFWLQADARRAYLDAKTKGYLGTRRTPDAEPVIDAHCPRRWLVILNIELNPQLLDA